MIGLGTAEGGFGGIACRVLNGVSVDLTYVKVRLDFVHMLGRYAIRDSPDFLFWRRYVLIGSVLVFEDFPQQTYMI